MARQRVKYATQCPTCLAGLWTSRLEFEVAELVSAATDLEVVVGARIPRTDRASDELIDLLIESVGLFVDLDPSRWHRAGESVDRDTRKLERLAGQQYVRIRPLRLGRLPSERADARQQILFQGAETDARSWSLAVLQALEVFSPSVTRQPLTTEVGNAAIARADARWRTLRTGPRRRSLRSEHPAVADQLVEVVGRPGLTADDLAPAGEDRGIWQCPACGGRWEARVANRTLLGTGCPPCSYRRGGARGAVPRPGQSFADRHPTLVAHFVEDQTNPGKTLSDLKPNSIDRCLWRCPHCSREWVTTPHHLNRNPAGGCRTCGRQRSGDRRKKS